MQFFPAVELALELQDCSMQKKLGPTLRAQAACRTGNGRGKRCDPGTFYFIIQVMAMGRTACSRWIPVLWPQPVLGCVHMLPVDCQPRRFSDDWIKYCTTGVSHWTRWQKISHQYRPRERSESDETWKETECVHELSGSFLRGFAETCRDGLKYFDKFLGLGKHDNSSSYSYQHQQLVA